MAHQLRELGVLEHVHELHLRPGIPFQLEPCRAVHKANALAWVFVFVVVPEARALPTLDARSEPRTRSTRCAPSVIASSCALMLKKLVDENPVLPDALDESSAVTGLSNPFVNELTDVLNVHVRNDLGVLGLAILRWPGVVDDRLDSCGGLKPHEIDDGRRKQVSVEEISNLLEFVSRRWPTDAVDLDAVSCNWNDQRRVTLNRNDM